MQEVVKKKKIVDPIITKKVVGCFKRYFFQSYITKHEHWPDVRRELIPIHSKMRLALEAGVTDFTEYHEQIPIEEWADLCFNKLCDFDYYDDWSQLIEDKAIAPYLSDWKSIYDKNLLEFIPDEGIRNTRRVIIECLTKEKVDVKVICETILRKQTPKIWNILLFHAKERERKVDSRLFAMMVLEKWLYFCVTEANIAKNIMPYFPQQTMTMTEIDLTHRLLFLTKESEEINPLFSVFINFDFVKWNLQWRM